MPLTDFQRGVARLIAANRTPEGHVAGGAVINRGDAGLRISEDLGIFHDVAEGGLPAGHRIFSELRGDPHATPLEATVVIDADPVADWLMARP